MRVRSSPVTTLFTDARRGDTGEREEKYKMHTRVKKKKKILKGESDVPQSGFAGVVKKKSVIFFLLLLLAAAASSSSSSPCDAHSPPLSLSLPLSLRLVGRHLVWK